MQIVRGKYLVEKCLGNLSGHIFTGGGNVHGKLFYAGKNFRGIVQEGEVSGSHAGMSV